MRKLLALLLAALLAAPTLSGNAAAGEAGKLSGKKLTVGTMALVLGLPVRLAQQRGYFKDAGLDLDIIIFATGAPINEAMGAEQIDLAVSGMASVFGLSTGRFKYIGDGIITKAGQAIYARQGSEFTKVKGPRPDLYGSAKLVKGANILGPLATSVHFHAIRYAEAFGLTADDFNMVSMDHPQAMQAFISGQGDLLASAAPWSNQMASAGYFRVSDLGESLGINLIDTVFVQPEILAERRADLLAFLECFYRAGDELNKDKELWKKVAQEWYAEEGRTVTDEQIAYEQQQIVYSTLDNVLAPGSRYGDCMLSIGEFFVDQGMIPKENYSHIEKSLDSSLLQELKAKHGKK